MIVIKLCVIVPLALTWFYFLWKTDRQCVAVNLLGGVGAGAIRNEGMGYFN